MKKIYSVLILFAIMIEALAPAAFAENVVNIYVSPAGNASASGSLSDPVNSIASAAEAAKRYSGSNVNILFHGGKYYLNNTQSLGEENSAAGGKTITYMPYGDGDVVFYGGAELDRSGFSKVSDPGVLKKIPYGARDKVLRYDLSDNGLNFSTSDSVRPYFYVNNILKVTARYPNSGHLWAASANGGSSFSFSAYDVSKWSQARDAFLTGSLEATYFWYTVPMSVSGSVINVSRNVRKNSEFYVENMIEELDVPGEYFIDRRENILYYYPDVDMDSATFEVSCNFKNAVNMSGCSNIIFDGLKFDKIGGKVFNILNANNIVIRNCAFDYCQGSDAIYLEGFDCKINDNSFYGCANKAITFHGGRVSDFTPGNIEVFNNRISMCGYLEKVSVISSGAAATSVPVDYKNKVYHNLIQDCMSFIGININANENEINYNEIINQGYYIGDGGAIYMGRSNSKPGTEVAYNYIHDGHKGDPNYYAYCGIYSDDGYGGSYFHHNVVKDMYQGMIINIGMNCRFYSNLFINNYRDAGGISVMTSYSADGGAIENGQQSGFYNEVNTIINRTVYGSVFAEHYPYLKNTLSRKPYFATWDSVVLGNISINSGKAYPEPWHPYYKKDGTTPVIDGEAAVIRNRPDALYYTESWIGWNKYNGYAVNDMAAYGTQIKKNGTELNCTAAGNPTYSYNNAYFKDPANQDYSLTSAIALPDFSSVSNLQALAPEYAPASEIDMSEIGLISSQNPEIFGTDPQEVELSSPSNNAENVYENEIPFAWKRAKHASKYRLVIATDSQMNNIVSDETVFDTSDALIETRDLNKGTKYYWQVTAYGLAKTDPYEITSDVYSFTTRSDDIYDTEELEYIASMAKRQTDLYEIGAITYEDPTMYYTLKSLMAQADELISGEGEQSSVYALEDSLLEKLSEAKSYVSEEIDPEIISVIVDQRSLDVTVYGRGFAKTSMYSVMVTNPGYDRNGAEGNFGLGAVQYIDTLKTDSNGALSFTFNTRVEGVDRKGIYTVYISTDRGLILSKTYVYATVSAGDITFYDGNSNSISDISAHQGEEIYAKCNIDNGTDKQITPAIVTAFYNGEKLLNVKISEGQSINAKSQTEISWSFTADTGNATYAKVMFLDSVISLRPLTEYRVIYEKN